MDIAGQCSVLFLLPIMRRIEKRSCETMLGRRTAAAPCAMVLAPLAAHLSLFAGFMDLAGDTPTLSLLTFINKTNQ